MWRDRASTGAKTPAGDADLVVMERLDQLFTERPFYGSRRMTLQLCQEGHAINRKHVQRLMRQMGIVALGPKCSATIRVRARDNQDESCRFAAA